MKTRAWTPSPGQRMKTAAARTRRLATSLSLSLLVMTSGACGADEGRDATPPAPKVEAVPRFEEAPCPTPSWPGLIEGQNVRCGQLFVSQDRRQPDGLVLRLPVMIVRGVAQPKADPIVHLLGGPGAAMEAYQEVLGNTFGLALSTLTQRELILFDQRGTGGSQPPFTCQPQEETEACLARLKAAGQEVAALNSQESAADVEDLRVALGLEQINLYGQSYGTTLALTVARLYPEGVRSMMLESTSAIAYDALLTSSAKSFELVAQRLLQECAEDEACRERFPELAPGLEGVITMIPAGSEVSLGVLQGLRLLMELAQGTSYVPLLIQALLREDEVTLNALVAYLQTLGGMEQGVSRGFNELMFRAVSCYDYGPLWSVARDEEVNGQSPASLRAAFGVDVEATRGMCQALPASRVSDAQRQPVRSDLPTLLLAGEHDPNTPLEVAQQVQRDLSRSHLITRKGWGHVMMALGDRCAQRAYADFLERPEQRPMTPCLESERTIFATSAP